MHPYPAQHGMIAPAKDRGQTRAKYWRSGALDGFSIFKNDDGPCSVGRYKFENAICQFQPRIFQSWLARDASVGKLVLPPDKSEAFTTFYVAPKINLAGKKCCQVNGEPFGRVGCDKRLKQGSLKGQSLPSVDLPDRGIKPLGCDRSVERQGDLDPIINKQ
jgi:hypothetical protein